MPSYTAKPDDYVHWQTARRQQAERATKEAAVDIFRKYQQLLMNGSKTTRQCHQRSNLSLPANNSDVGLFKVAKTTTVRPDMSGALHPKKGGSLNADNASHSPLKISRECTGSHSRRSQIPFSTERSDVSSKSLPEAIKITREKSQIYLALNSSDIRNTGKTKRDLSMNGKRYILSSGNRDSPLSGKRVSSLVGRRDLPMTRFPKNSNRTVAEVSWSDTILRGLFNFNEVLNSREHPFILPTQNPKIMATNFRHIPRDQPKPEDALNLEVPPGVQLSYLAPRTIPPTSRGGRCHTFSPCSKLPSVCVVSTSGQGVPEGVVSAGHQRTVEVSNKRHNSRARPSVAFKTFPARHVNLNSQKLPVCEDLTSSPGKHKFNPSKNLPQPFPVQQVTSRDSCGQMAPQLSLGPLSYNVQFCSRGQKRLQYGTKRQTEMLIIKPVKGDDTPPTQAVPDDDRTLDLTNPELMWQAQASYVSAMKEIYIPYAPPASAFSLNSDNASDTESEENTSPLVIEPTITFTVTEEGDKIGPDWAESESHFDASAGNDKESSEDHLPRAQDLGFTDNKNPYSSGLLAVPSLINLSESRPPLQQPLGTVSINATISDRPASHRAKLKHNPALLERNLTHCDTETMQSTISKQMTEVKSQPIRAKTLYLFSDMVQSSALGSGGTRHFNSSADDEAAQSHGNKVCAATHLPSSITKDQLLKTQLVDNKLLKPSISSQDIMSGLVENRPLGDDLLPRPKLNPLKTITFVSPLGVQENAKRY